MHSSTTRTGGTLAVLHGLSLSVETASSPRPGPRLTPESHPLWIAS